MISQVCKPLARKIAIQASTTRNMNNILAISRISIGLSVWTMFPRFIRSLGFSANKTELTYTNRVFASRDIGLGVGTLLAQDTDQTLWSRIGLACDAADLAAALIGSRQGLSRRTSTLMIITPLLGIGIGALAGCNKKAPDS